MSSAAPSQRLIFAALLAPQVLFGINYVASKVVIGVFPPLVWGSMRIAICSAVMLSVALLSGRKHPVGGIRFFGPLALFALLGTIINQASFLTGLRYTTSTNSAILNTTIPVMTLLIVTLRGQEPVTLRRILGFICAFLGVLLIRRLEDFTLSNKTLIGDLLTLVNCLSFSLFLCYSKTFMGTHDRIWTTTWLFIYGSVGLTLLALPQWRDFHWPVMTPTLWAAAGFAVIGATLVTYFLNVWTLAHARSSQVALYIYLQPVVTCVVAWTWMHQAITVRAVIANVFIFLGLLLATSPGTFTRRAIPVAPAAGDGAPATAGPSSAARST